MNKEKIQQAIELLKEAIEERDNDNNSGSPRVLRGGGWDDGPAHLRSAFRNRGGPAWRGYGVGFRLVRECKLKEESNPDRVLRGGGWHYSPAHLRSAGRSDVGPASRYAYVGFRLVRTYSCNFNSLTLEDNKMDLSKTKHFEFKKISTGTFIMGSPESEKNRFSDEKQHEVTIDKEFEIQTTQVTQEQWKKVMGSNPSRFKNNPYNPVETVSYNDVQEFIQKLNDSQDEYTYRLPTEEEWEYCCRAGTHTAYSFGDSDKELGAHAWFYGNSENTTHPVATKLPNPWGLYDTHGNVWCWTSSVY